MSHHDDENQQKSNTLDLWTSASSTEMNLPQTLLFNIRISPYFKEDLYELKTYDSVLVEITEQVDAIRPFESGSDTKPHVCMILLYKLFTLRLTRKQLTGVLAKPKKKKKKKTTTTKGGTPWSYVRAIGFLYVRFCVKPVEMWEFFGPYVNEDDEDDGNSHLAIHVPSSGEKIITMGEFVRNIIQDQKYLGVLFPRIPQSMLNTLKKRIKESMGEESNAHRSGQYVPGSNRGKQDKYEDRYYGREREGWTRRTRSRSRDREYDGYRYRDSHSRDRDSGRGRKRYREYGDGGDSYGGDDEDDYGRRRQRMSRRDGHDYHMRRQVDDDDADNDSRRSQSRSRSRSLSPAESRFSAPPPSLARAGDSMLAAYGSARPTSRTVSSLRHSASDYRNDKIVLGGRRHKR